MLFYGLKKVTLIDYPSKIACTLFTHGCNLRCPFCHNPELVTAQPDSQQAIPEREVLEFLKKRGNKLDGIVVTGGEPLLLGWELEKFLTKVKKLGFSIKIDTNGTHPSALQRLIKRRLVDYVAMDFKASKPKYVSVMRGLPGDFDKAMVSLEMLKKSGIGFEVRTTVVPGIHDEAEIKRMIKHLRDIPLYVIQNYAPAQTIDHTYSNIEGFDNSSLEEFLRIARKVVASVEVRNQE